MTDKRDKMTTSDTDSRRESSAKTPAGKIITDSEGNRVWEWMDDTPDTTTSVLDRLNNDDLKLEETPAKRGSVLSREETVKGYDPYDKVNTDDTSDTSDTSDTVEPRWPD